MILKRYAFRYGKCWSITAPMTSKMTWAGTMSAARSMATVTSLPLSTLTYTFSGVTPVTCVAMPLS